MKNNTPEFLGEALGILPSGLYLADTVEGQDLYSSVELKGKFLKAIKSQRVISKVVDKMEDLVISDVILPCFVSKNIFKLLLHKTFGSFIDKSAMAYYHQVRNKVYVLMDNRTRFLLWMSNKRLSLVTIHELMHYTSSNRKQIFLRLFLGDLIKYYKEFFDNYTGLNIHTTQIAEIIKFLFSKIEWAMSASVDVLYRYGELLESIFSQYTDRGRATQLSLNVIVPLKVYASDPNRFLSMISRDGSIRRLMYSLLKAYRVLKIKNPRTTPIQELLYPSEVIAISSERPKNSHFEAIYAIKD